VPVKAGAAAILAAIAVLIAGCSGQTGATVASSSPTGWFSPSPLPVPSSTSPRVVQPAHLARSVPVRLQIPVIGVDSTLMDLGLRADGAYPLGDTIRLLYTAEYARQHDYADGDSRIDADYIHGGIGADWKIIYARVDYEVLGSNNGVYAFQTPLGTNHLFQGWADLFLTTPAKGIRDAYLTLGGPIEKARWSAEFHDFRSDFGNIHYGRELDFGVSYPLRKGLTGKIEYAGFREADILAPASARKRDTDKLWLTLVYNFE